MFEYEVSAKPIVLGRSKIWLATEINSKKPDSQQNRNLKGVHNVLGNITQKIRPGELLDEYYPK